MIRSLDHLVLTTAYEAACIHFYTEVLGMRRENVFTISQGIALERNRDEWMLRVRRMGSCPCKQPGRPIARFRSNAIPCEIVNTFLWSQEQALRTCLRSSTQQSQECQVDELQAGVEQPLAVLP